MLVLTAASGPQLLLSAQRIQEILPGDKEGTQVHLPDETTFQVQESPAEVRRQWRRQQTLELD